MWELVPVLVVAVALCASLGLVIGGWTTFGAALGAIVGILVAPALVPSRQVWPEG